MKKSCLLFAALFMLLSLQLQAAIKTNVQLKKMTVTALLTYMKTLSVTDMATLIVQVSKGDASNAPDKILVTRVQANLDKILKAKTKAAAAEYIGSVMDPTKNGGNADVKAYMSMTISATGVITTNVSTTPLESITDPNPNIEVKPEGSAVVTEISEGAVTGG